MTDRPDAADYGDAFLDVAREWESEPGEFGSRAHSLHALDFVHAVTARAAEYAERPDDSLDAAWAETEAALPEGWRMNEMWSWCEPEEGSAFYRANAVGPWPGRCSMGHDHGFTVVDGYGPTPAAALRALTAKLGEGEG